MKNCPHCQALMYEDDIFCPSCGKRVPNAAVKESTFFFSLLSFFLPILGFFIYLLGKETHPLRSKRALRSTILGLIFYLILGVLFFLFWLFIIIGIFTT